MIQRSTKMHRKFALFLQIYLILLLFQRISTDNCQEIRKLCFDQNRCADCIQIHHCCNWCYDENFNGFRCDIVSELNNFCNPTKLIVNNRTTVDFVKDEHFRNVNEDNVDAVQFKPQMIDVKLRLNEPVNFTIQYQAAKNYPLDLYYLMDLTLSMQQDLQTMTQLGVDLTNTLNKLTQLYKIAFGSYVDKTVMPFYLTDPDNYHTPCKLIGSDCVEGYLFKHRLNFTNNIDEFIRKIQESRVSANLDNLEGGLDALMQILMCHEELGWSQQSRKLVVLATESMMHLAGDGLLSGSVKKANNKQCLINYLGEFIDPYTYDYPSLEEIHRQLLDRKINVIIATKNGSLSYYKQLNLLIPESTFIGRLESDSTNILNLVQEGYYDFIKRVKIFINTTGIDGLNIDYFADCYGNGNLNKSDSCYNAEEERPINFTIQLHLTKRQDRNYDTLYLEERNIEERVRINLEYIGEGCDCGAVDLTKNCGEHGRVDCGLCKCDDGWQGDSCETHCTATFDSCRQIDEDYISTTCNGKGVCICGKCRCDFPFSGKYCQDNCPHDVKARTICGGITQGTCIDGNCICTELYTGDDCSCSLSQNNCRIPGAQILCNGHGSCECNQCKCDRGYSGQFCEICSECEGLCNAYLPCVIDNVDKPGTNNCTLGDVLVKTIKVDQLQNNTKITCYYRYQDNNCETRYDYIIQKERVDVQIEEPRCASVVGASMVISLIIAAIVGMGVIALIVWRAIVTRNDRIEYEKFVKDTMRGTRSEMNPLYKSPIVSYRNPMENIEFAHAKDD